MLTLIRTKTLEEKIHQAVVKALHELFADPEYSMTLQTWVDERLQKAQRGEGRMISFEEMVSRCKNEDT